MKKVLPAVIFTALAIILFQLSCKKSAHSDVAPGDEALVQTLRQWTTDQKLTLTKNKSFVDTLQASADWQRLTIKTINAHESMIFVPLKEGKDSTGLIYILNTSAQKVEQGYLLELTGNKLYGATAPEILQHFYQYKNLRFTGALAAYNFANQFKWEMGYQNGNRSYRKGLMNSGNAPKNKISSLPGGRQQLVSSAGNSCQAWYLVTYYDDGSTDWDYIGTTCNDCEMTRHSNSLRGAFAMDCGGGGGSGTGTTTVITYDTVHNNLSTPCYAATLSSMLSSGLSSDLASIFQTTFNTSDEINFDITEVANLGDPNASGQTNATRSGNYVNVQTTLNNAQLANASKEYIAETMFHEILHGYLDVSGTIKGSMPQHCEMITGYVDKELAALQELFPSLTSHDGLCLILSGMSEVHEYDSATFNTVMASYNLGLTDVVQTNDYFKTGNCGLRCNPNVPLN